MFVLRRGAAPACTQRSTPEPSEVDPEFMKLDPMFQAVRSRTAQDYAITSDNGIDEAMYVDETLMTL